MRLDLHTNSRHSPDSRLDPRDIVRQARSLGLDGIALTDHNAITGVNDAREYAKESEGFVVIGALEVSTTEGHILGYGVKELIPRDLTPQETVERIVAQGGVAVAAHPYRFWSGLGERVTLNTPFAIYEVQNARTSRRGNGWATDLAARGGKGRTGGSDGHFIDEIGRAVTVLEERLQKEDDVLQAMAGRRTDVAGVDRSLRATMRYVPKSVVEWMGRGFRRI